MRPASSVVTVMFDIGLSPYTIMSAYVICTTHLKHNILTQNTSVSSSSRRGVGRTPIGSGTHSTSAADTDSSYTITTLEFLETRRDNEHSADLVSCGGNGWVRFWNSRNCHLHGEFIAHPHGNLIGFCAVL